MIPRLITNSVPQPAEIDAPQPPVCFANGCEDVVTLGPDDFQRIGLQPSETRLDVIRRAASRATRALARRQLSAPNPLTEQQLSLIAVSTYRLLDPRQRDDRRARAHVGRIRPGALYRAGRAEFAIGDLLIQSCEASEESVNTHHVKEIPMGVVKSRHRKRRRSRRLLGTLAVTVALAAAAAAAWHSGPTY